MKLKTLIITTCLLIALVILMSSEKNYAVNGIEEEIIVEKEVDPSLTIESKIQTPPIDTKPKSQPIPQQQNIPNKENVNTNVNTEQTPQRNGYKYRNLNEELSERRAFRNLMREMRNYQFGHNDLFNFHHPTSNLFGNSLFNAILPTRSFFGNPFMIGDEMFNLDHRSVFEMMSRRMNNMWRRSSLLSSMLFNDQHEWLENNVDLNQPPRQDQAPQQATTPQPVEKKKREPISSVVKSESQPDGTMLYSLDISNIPNDVFDKKDIEIKISENSLGDLITVRAEKKTENGHFEFSKSFRFPKGSVDFEQVKASLSDSGTLSVKIPRIDENESTKRVKSISVE